MAVKKISDAVPALVPTPKKIRKMDGYAMLPAELDCNAAPEKQVAFWTEHYKRNVVATLAKPSDTKLAVRVNAGIEGGDEAYRLLLSKEPALEANTEKGILWGLQTLAQLARSATGQGRTPAMEIHDWPAVEWRGFQYDLARASYRPEFAKQLVRQLSALKYNVLQLNIEHNFVWDAFPELHEPDAISPDEARELEDYASQYCVQIIPATNVCRHMEGFLLNPRFKHLKELPLARGTVPGGMLCVAHPEAWDFIRTILDEMLDAFSSKHFHLGFDETHFIGKHPRSLKKSPAEWYSNWINRTVKYVRKAGRRAHIWGDKFLLQQDFPNLSCCNGGWPGDIRKAIDLIDRDIVIQDWHYYSSGGESVRFFGEKGFEVWAGGLVQSSPNFICHTDLEVMPRFYQNAIAAGAKGVIATSWGYSAGFNLWDRLLVLGLASDSIWDGKAPELTDFERRWTRIRHGKPLRIIPALKDIGEELPLIVTSLADGGGVHEHSFGDLTRTTFLSQTDFFSLPKKFNKADAEGISRLRKTVAEARQKLGRIVESAKDNAEELDAWHFYIDIFDDICGQLETIRDVKGMWRSLTAKGEPRVYSMAERRAVLNEIQRRLEEMYDRFLVYMRIQLRLCREQGMPVQRLHEMRALLAELATAIQKIRETEETGIYPEEPDIFGGYL